MIIKTLGNGLRVVLVPLSGMKSVTVELQTKLGSKYENEKEHGLSHFLEHMAFKGTSKRPKAIEVNREIDSRGANYNAETSQEITSYYITTVAENWGWAVELLGDIVLNPLILESEVNSEKGVIIEELKMYRDNPAIGLGDDFYEYMLGESKLGCWSVGGRVDEVKRYRGDDLRDFRRKYFRPEKMILVIAGNIASERQVIKQTDLVWGWFENKGRELPKVIPKITGLKSKKVTKQVEQGHFCLGVEGITRGDKRKDAYKLLEIILMGNTSSRLFNEIREKRGWAYYVQSISESFEETGIMAVQSGVRRDHLEESIEICRQEMLGLADNLTEREMELAKNYYLGKIGLLTDRSEFWAEMVGEKLLLEERVVDVKAELEKIKNVKLNEVSELARDLFRIGRFRELVLTSKS